MPREKQPDDLMGRALKGTVPQRRAARDLDQYSEKRELKNISLRLPVDDLAVMTRYFRSRGLNLSNGIRMWLSDRIEQEELR